MTDRVALLRQIALFSQVEAEHLQRLAAAMVEQSYLADEIILREGDPGTEFLIISAGKVAITKGESNEILAILNPGQFFGEMALLDGAPRAAGAVARTDVKVLLLSRADLHTAILAAPDILWRMAPTLTQRLRETSNRLMDSLNAVEERNRELQDSYRKMEESNSELQGRLRRNWRSRVGIAGIVVLMFAGAAGYLQVAGGTPQTSDSAAAVPPPPPGAIAPVAAGPGHVFAVEPRPIHNSVTLTGRLDPRRVVNLPSPISANVAEVLFNYGDVVHKGDVLVRLDTAELESRIRDSQSKLIRAEQELHERKAWNNGTEVANARRSLVRAENAVTEARRGLAETQALFAKGIIPEREVLSAQQTLTNADIDLAAAREAVAASMRKGGNDYVTMAEFEAQNARAALKELTAQRAAAEVRAPTSGVALRPTVKEGGREEDLEVGRKVGSDQILLAIGETASLAVRTSVDEFDVTKIAPGQAVKVTTEALAHSLDGRVLSVSSQPQAAESQTRAQVARYPLTVVIDRLDGAPLDLLRLGMSASMEIVIRSTDQALLVPPAAIATAADGTPQVMRMAADGSRQTVPVRLGGRYPTGVEVLEGLAAGDRLWLPGPS